MTKVLWFVLAFVLSDLGYDVWLINARGFYYSLKRRNLSTHDNVYWDFRQILHTLIKNSSGFLHGCARLTLPKS